MSHGATPLRKPPEVAWRARRGEARHAYRVTDRGRVAPAPALCGAQWFDPRWERPDIREKCEGCTAQLDELTRAAIRGPAAMEMGL